MSLLHHNLTSIMYENNFLYLCLLCLICLHYVSPWVVVGRAPFGRIVQKQAPATGCMPLQPSATSLHAKKRRRDNDVKDQSISIVEKAESDSVATFDDAGEQEMLSDTGTSRAKLVAEATAPFSLFRKFIYGGMGAAGGIGTITAIPPLIFALQDSGGDHERLLTAAKNIAIDLAAVLSATFLYIRERKQENDKLDKIIKLEQKVGSKLSKDQSREREALLGKLPVEIQVSEYDVNATRIVSLADLQLKGKQSAIVVTGGFDFVRDAVLSAKIEGSESFMDEEVVVIPFVSDSIDSKQLDENAAKGFAKKEGLMTAPYIAKPMQVITSVPFFVINCCLLTLSLTFSWMCGSVS